MLYIYIHLITIHISVLFYIWFKIKYNISRKYRIWICLSRSFGQHYGNVCKWIYIVNRSYITKFRKKFLFYLNESRPVYIEGEVGAVDHVAQATAGNADVRTKLAFSAVIPQNSAAEFIKYAHGFIFASWLTDILYCNNDIAIIHVMFSVIIINYYKPQWLEVMGLIPVWDAGKRSFLSYFGSVCL